MIGALLLAAAQAASAAPAAPAWELVIELPNGRMFVDPASIRRDAERVSFLALAARSAESPDGVQNVFADLRIDCAARTMTVFRERYYGARGNLVRSNELGAEGGPPQRIRRGSPANSAFYRRLCGAELDAG